MQKCEEQATSNALHYAFPNDLSDNNISEEAVADNSLICERFPDCEYSSIFLAFCTDSEPYNKKRDSHKTSRCQLLVVGVCSTQRRGCATLKDDCGLSEWGKPCLVPVRLRQQIRQSGEAGRPTVLEIWGVSLETGLAEYTVNKALGVMSTFARKKI